MNKKILNLAIPNIITNMTVPLLGMVDLAIVGHIGNQVHIGAIAVGTAIFNLIYWNFGFLRMGTSGFTAQAYGGRDMKESISVLARGLSVAVLIGLLILALQNIISGPVLKLLNASEEVSRYALDYFSVRVWAAPFTLSMYVFKGWFIGMQNSRTPMWIAISMNIVNIIMSLLFVYVLDMGIKGVAFGTVLSQLSGVVVSLIIWMKWYGKLSKYFSLKAVVDLKALSRFFRVNSDIFLRTICLVVVFTFFTSASSAQGDMALAVNSILLQLFVLFSYFMDGFAYAAEALVGRYTGAENMPLLKKSVKSLLMWGLIITLVFTLTYATSLKWFLSWFTSSQDVIDSAMCNRWWITAVPLAGFLAFIYDGILIGASESVLMRNSMFVSTVMFFACYYILLPELNGDALWVAFLVYLSLRGVTQMVFSRKKLL